jgi:hypothetical protein|tara:strand:- start:275 stop:1009 length:735 start_codon:yes stop_codon:yes gene_type:complete
MHLDYLSRILSDNPNAINPDTGKPFTEKEKLSVKTLFLGIDPSRFKKLFPKETKGNLKKYKAHYEELDKEDKEYQLREFGTEEEYLKEVEAVRRNLISYKHEEENKEFLEFIRMKEIAKKRVLSEIDAELLLKPDDLDDSLSDSFQHYFFIRTDRGGSIILRGIPDIGDTKKMIKTSHSQNEIIDILTEPVEVEIGVFHYLDDKLTYKTILRILIDEEIQHIKKSFLKKGYNEFANAFVRGCEV